MTAGASGLCVFQVANGHSGLLVPDQGGGVMISRKNPGDFEVFYGAFSATASAEGRLGGPSPRWGARRLAGGVDQRSTGAASPGRLRRGGYQGRATGRRHGAPLGQRGGR